jgi:signal transduction histidine kinase/CheY-like chemotaxis protein
MNLATVISLVAASLDMFIGALVFGLARAPGWRHFRIFPLIAFSAAAYSLANAAFSHAQAPAAWIAPLGRLNGATAALNAIAWVVFVRQQNAEPLRMFDRVLVWLLAALGVAALVPHVILGDNIVEQAVPWAGLSYRVTELTLGGHILAALVVLTYCWTAFQYITRLWRGNLSALSQLPGFAIFLATTVNEALVSTGHYSGLYLIDIGLLAVLLGISVDVVLRVTADAAQLRTFTSRLSLEVEERTKELTSAKQHLAHSDRLAGIGRLSASIGHEINNPLTYVINNIDYALDETRLWFPSSGVIEALEEASEGVERIRNIVRELRSFSRSSDQEPDVLIPIQEVLEGAIRLTAGQLRHVARLEREMQANPLVFGSPTRLTQVFVNILTNAAQAIPASRAGTHAAQIVVRVSLKPGSRVLVEVEDSGTGIDETERERLFEPFFTTKPIDRGTGLGLFVSLGIVTAAGGQLDIRNRTVGAGSIVSVELPVAKEAESVPPSSSVPRVSGKSLSVLVVDDDFLVAKTLARVLRRHKVEVVTNGEEAWERLTTPGVDFDAVVCDLMMPELSGIDLYARILAKRPDLAQKFLFTSGGVATEAAQHFVAVHADRFLPKPVDNALLHQLVADRAALAARGGLGDPRDSERSANG